MPTSRAHLLAFTVWTTLCVLFFWSFLNGTAHLADGDFTGQFHASAVHQGRALFGDTAVTENLLWSPTSYAGFPFAADPQTAVFYPPRWFTLFLSQTGDVSVYALQIEAVFHIWLAGLFAGLLAYEITRRHEAAVLAAISFGLGGYLTAYPMLQLAVLESVIWLPLTLWLLRRGVQSAQPLRWLATAGFSLALSALAGHPQTFLHVSYAAAAYYLFLTVRGHWSWVSTLKFGGLITGTAVGTAAIALLPAIRYTLYTTRRNVEYGFTARGLPLEDYVQLILPDLRSHWAPEYSGLLVLLLALVAWFGRRTADNNLHGEIRFWGGLSVLAGWLALGDNGILFQLAYAILPGFRLFQQQERLLSVVSLGMALLAALGTAVYLQASPAERRRFWQNSCVVTAVFLLLSGLYATANPSFSGQAWPMLWAQQAILLAIIAGALFLAHNGRFAPRIFLLFLIPLQFADLYINTSGSVDRRPGSPAIFWPEPDWLHTLRADLPPLARIDTRNLLHADVGALYRLEDVNGISPLKFHWWADWQRLPAERRWQLLGVSHVLGHNPPTPTAEQIAIVDESIYPMRELSAYLYRLAEPLPRAWLSYQPVAADDETAAWQSLAAPEFDPVRQVILHPPLPNLPEIVAPTQPPAVTTTRLANNALRIAAQTETPGILVISEWAYPGWQAELNGRAVDWFTVNHALIGIALPPGEHELLLTFRPWDVPLGAAVTLLTITAVGLFIWRRRPLPETRPILRSLEKPDFSPDKNPVSGYLSRIMHHASRYQLVIAALVLLAFGLRLHTADSQELRGDETYGYQFMRLPVGEMLRDIAALGEEHPPLHYILLNGWIRLAGDSELAMRFLAVIPGVLLVPLLWRAGRRWHDRSLGVLLALFAAISPSLVWLGQDVRNQYVMVIFSGTLATLLFQRAVQRPRPAFWLAYALACALTIYSHYYGIFALLAHGVTLLILSDYRRLLPAYIASGMVGAALFAPWLVVTFSGWVGQLALPSGMEMAPYLHRVGRELIVGPAFPAALGRWFFLGGLILAVVGWRALWARNRVTAVILAVWLSSTLFVVFLVALQRDIFNAYYVSPAAPAWWGLIGMGIVALWRGRGWRQGLAAVSVAALVVTAAVSLSNYYREPVEHGRTRGYRDLVIHVAAQQQSGDLFLANFPDPSIGYYLRHLDVAYDMQPATNTEQPAQTEQALADLFGQYDRLWFVPEESGLWDKTGYVARWLDYHALIEESRRFHRLTLTAYRPPHAVDTVMTRLNQPITDWGILAGYYLTVDGVPCAPLQPNSELAVSLIWHGRSPAPTGYTVFVHLLAADGRLIAQHDGVPLYGTRPTTGWQADERLIDRHLLTIPAEAALENAQLQIGLYDSATIGRLPLPNGQDSLPLDLNACRKQTEE